MIFIFGIIKQDQSQNGRSDFFCTSLLAQNLISLLTTKRDYIKKR
jgi:hypothetical protein